MFWRVLFERCLAPRAGARGDWRMCPEAVIKDRLEAPKISKVYSRHSHVIVMSGVTPKTVTFAL